MLSLIFALISLSLIVSSGWQACDSGRCVQYFAEWQMHDALWHISVATQSFGSEWLANPLHSETTIRGYNYGFNLVLALFTPIFGPFLSYFQILPLIAVVCYLALVKKYLQKYTLGSAAYLLNLFLFLFAGGMSYLIPLSTDSTLLGGTLRGFPVVTSLYPASMMLNLPYAFSLSLLLYLLISVRDNQLGRWSLIKVAVWFFLAFGLKFYLGVVGLILFVLSFKQARRFTNVLGMLLGSGLAYLLFYYRPASDFPFSFSPLALTHLIYESDQLFHSPTLTLARYYLYDNREGLPLKLIGIELSALALFFLLNFGPRLILGLNLRKLWQDPYTQKLLLTTVFLSLIPIFFVQRGGWYNTMQFLYYAVFLANILLSQTLLGWYQRAKVSLLFIVPLLILSLPNSLEQLRYPFLPHNTVTHSELQAYAILRDQPAGVVHVNRPWAKRAVIPALTGKPMYYLDTDQLMLFLPDYHSRLQLVEKNQGGSISQLGAAYFVIYKNEVASPDSYATLKNNPNFVTLFDDADLALFARLVR